MDPDYYDNPDLHLVPPTSAVGVLQTAQPAVIVYTTRDAAVFSANGRADAAGHLFFSWHELAGNDTVVVVRQADGAGHVVAEWRIPPPPGFKIDHSSLMPSGHDLWVWMDAHQPVSGQRDNVTAYAVIPGVFTPWPDGHAEQDGGTVVESAPPPPDPTPGGAVDLTDGAVNAVARKVLDLIQASVQSLQATDLGKELQKLAKNGATEALAGQSLSIPAYLRTSDVLLTVLCDGLYHWAIDRSYEGALAALGKAGTTTAAASGEPGGQQMPPPTGSDH